MKHGSIISLLREREPRRGISVLATMREREAELELSVELVVSSGA